MHLVGRQRRDLETRQRLRDRLARQARHRIGLARDRATQRGQHGARIVDALLGREVRIAEAAERNEDAVARRRCVELGRQRRDDHRVLDPGVGELAADAEEILAYV